MCKLLNQQSAPELNIDSFAGDQMEFHCFMTVPHEVLGRKVDDVCMWKAYTFDKIHQR